MQIPPRFASTLLIRKSPNEPVPNTGNTLQMELLYRQLAYMGELYIEELGDKAVLVVFPNNKEGMSEALEEVVDLADSIDAQRDYFPDDHEELTSEKIRRYQAMVQSTALFSLKNMPKNTLRYWRGGFSG
jgi:hypothetical protein